MNEVETLLTYAIWSGYLDDENPVSVLVIADVSEGKSAVLEQYSGCPNVLTINHMTRTGLVQELRDDIKRRKLARDAGTPVGLSAPTHVTIPDLSQILLGNQAYVGETKATIMALTAEGLGRVRTMYTDVDFQAELGDKLHCGILTSVARHDFMDKRRKLADIGFTSRFVPFSYSFKMETKYAIFKRLLEGRIEERVSLNLPAKKQHVVLAKEIAGLLAIDQEYFDRKRGRIEDEWGGTEADKTEEIEALVTELMPRRADQLRTMVKACALRRGRTEVSQEDVKEILQLQKWMNEDEFRVLR